jgi:Bifunctional DNA primase/polymerase, N-terminal.
MFEKEGEREREGISTVFNRPDVGFLFLPCGQKNPPDSNEWQKRQNQHTFQEAQTQKSIRNVGVVAGNDYIILDVDDSTALNGLDLPTSTKWETRPGRYAMWFKCEDRIPTLGKRKYMQAKPGCLYLIASNEILKSLRSMQLLVK